MRRFWLTLLLAACPMAAATQNTPATPATLIADELFIENDQELVARGNVEAFQGTTRVTATEIRYDRTTGAMSIIGPITLEDGTDVTVLASAAELDTSLQTGLLTSARMVMSQQLQLAAVRIQRVNARYSQLYKAAVTSCRICEDGSPPLWQIRARRVIHDTEEHQLYFDDAQFLIGNIPVFYIPRLRLPDPTLERATGFLAPTIEQTTNFGIGIKLPYFINLAPDRDLTVTPYIAEGTRTVELRYRQAFRKGDIVFEGAISRDDVEPGDTRGYIFGSGNFSLRNDFELTFDIEATTDESYLSQYGVSTKDRLDSAIAISRTRRDEFISFGLTAYNSLRDTDDNATLPTLVIDGVYETRHFPTQLGGELRLGAYAHSHYRESDTDIDGRDVSRFTTEADWLRSWTLPGGLRADLTLGATVDAFNVTQDSTVPQNQTQLSPRGAVALRYPLARSDRNGVTQFLEPLVQIAWVGGDQIDVPNEESTSAEFDGGNLTALSRFSAPDRREHGRTFAYGVNWSRFDPNGPDTSLTFGQVLRQEANTSFTETSGLDGISSDYLVAGQLRTQNGLLLTAQTLFDTDLDFSKAEIRGDYTGSRSTLSGSYLWLTADQEEDRTESIAEITLDGGYQLNRYWIANADWQYDITSKRASSAGVGLQYENECVSIGLSVDRTYATSSTLEPATTLSFTIGLEGFSARKGTETYTKTCG